MKKILIATAALTLMCSSAFAQTSTGPGAQGDNMTKPGMAKGTMEKGSMDKGSMNKGTTGMNNGMKDPNATPNNQDATGQGTVGPGSNNGMKK
jgi:pentapeptide MXKDX repeat protein